MPDSLFAPDFQAVLDQAVDQAGKPAGPFPSPQDWRDKWIYFLMVDRFNNPHAGPVHEPFDDPGFFGFQGGKFSGIRDQLKYIRDLGAGAIWLSPVLRNVGFEQGTYHGYGIRDFVMAESRFADDPTNADEELRQLVDSAHAAGLYVIFDIVLNHTGNVFAYSCDVDDKDCQNSAGAESRFHASAQPVRWRNAQGAAPAQTQPIEDIQNPARDALVWPRELQKDLYFRRQGGPLGGGDDTVGDFASLKQFRTDLTDVQSFLIRAYQYVIARFDVDGFRIDTLRYLKNDLARLFGNSMREFALSIGKENFFTFGEVLTSDSEDVIARFIGRSTRDISDLVGVDAALDYPLLNQLKPLVKGFNTPADLTGMYQRRKDIEQNILSSHGDATRFFVTFLDNHDMKERIRFEQPGAPTRFDGQVTLGIACLMCLQGIPCVYYGTEQGLHGAGSDAAVREALWGGPGFDKNSKFYLGIQKIAAVREQQAALRYGRMYFRQVSGDGMNFGVSTFKQGVVAFSRILNDQEVLAVANTNPDVPIQVDVIVDSLLSRVGSVFRVLYSNQANPSNPLAVRQTGPVSVQELDGSKGNGPLHVVNVRLEPLEIQVLRQ
jgi:glycosidase